MSCFTKNWSRGVSNQVRHKSGCVASGNVWKFRFWEVEEFYMSSKTKGAGQLFSYPTAVLWLCFAYAKMLIFSREAKNGLNAHPLSMKISQPVYEIQHLRLPRS